MIKIDKTKYQDGTKVETPESLSARKSYKGDDVIKTLKSLFHSKCAYCESKYTHLMPVDIEHFRPKSKYTWLEFDWDNLLPSCIDCNRKRYQVVQEGEIILTGKKDDFPLYNAIAPLNNVENEDDFDFQEEEKIRQLINPCIENPEDYFEYDDDGFILSKNSEIDTIERGKKSIETFGLYRMELVKARKEHLLKIIATIQRIEENTKGIDNVLKLSNGDTIMDEQLNIAIVPFKNNLESDIKLLKECVDDSSIYSAMARQYINHFLSSFEFDK